MKNLRVAMIAPPWLPIPPASYGGIENVLAALVPALRRLGAEVELFTIGATTIRSNKRHSLYKTAQYDNIHRPYYDSLPILISHQLAALQQISRDGKFDIIHDHNPYIGPAMLAYADESLPPILHTLHGPPFTTPDRLNLSIPDNAPMWQQFAKLNRVQFLNISHAARNYAPPSFRRRLLEPVHNGIDPSQYKFRASKSDYFITLARFHPDKGQLQAIKACRSGSYQLKMAGIVGDMTRPKQVMLELANPLSTYRSLIDFRYFSDHIFPELDSQIEYVGNVSGAAKINFVNQARALLFPVQWEEPFGMAPIEALACGTPVIATARGALPEIIEHGVNGFLANNNREFQHYLKRIGDIDPAACRKSVEQKFSATSMAEKYLDRYRIVLRGHTGSS
ncbi:MAG: glycosyltransferase family 4 protein [Candidatus Saccharimonadales bacterium]